VKANPAVSNAPAPRHLAGRRAVLATPPRSSPSEKPWIGYATFTRPVSTMAGHHRSDTTSTFPHTSGGRFPLEPPPEFR
jgi:hypothetical protein